MGLTTVVLLMVIIWAVKSICHDLGITSAAKKRIKRRLGEDEE